MSLHPLPSIHALRIGHTRTREFVWDGLADNRAGGVNIAEALPLSASRHLAMQAPQDQRLVVTDSPDNWEFFPQSPVDDIDATNADIQELFSRQMTAGRVAPGVIVFDVAPHRWTAALADACHVALRQGRSYGVYVLIRGELPNLGDELMPPAALVPLTLAPSRRDPFPSIIARYSLFSHDEMEEQPLTFDLDIHAVA